MPPPILTITGSSRNDQITGTSADDIIGALAGNDVVRAGDGDDVVLGNLGNDKLFGEDGADRLSGDQGNDNIDGGDGLDTAVYTGSRDDYQVTTDANGVTEVKDLRSGRPNGIDHVVNTEFFDFNGDVFQLQDGDLVPYEPPPEPGFAGNTVHYQAYILNLSTPYPFASNGDFLVGDSIEVSNIIDGLATLNITNDTLIFDFNSSFNFVNYPFVGSVLSDTADNLPEITDVYIIENDVTGFELSDISHDANNVYVNFAGASGNAASHIVLGVDFV